MGVRIEDHRHLSGSILGPDLSPDIDFDFLTPSLYPSDLEFFLMAVPVSASDSVCWLQADSETELRHEACALDFDLR